MGRKESNQTNKISIITLKKEEKESNVKYVPTANRPQSSGSKDRHANHKATRSGRARIEITVHIGQIIRVWAIFEFANKVKGVFFTLFDFA